MKPTFLLILSLVLLSSCKKDDPEVVLLDEEFKAYTVFQDSTWWIYQNDADPLDLDTVVVTDAAREFSEVGRETFTAEYCSYKKTVRGVEYTTVSFPYWVAPGKSIGLNRETRRPSSHEYDFFDELFDRDTLSIVLDNAIYISNRYPEYTIGTETFSNAVEVTHKFSRDGHPVRTLLWVKNIGVIQREFWDGTVWKLIEYHINQ